MTYVLQRIDALRALLNLTANDLRNELRGELSQRAALSLLLHNLHHLLPDLPDLRAPRVRRLLDLIRPPLRERNAEQSEIVVVGGLDDGIRFDQSLPFAHQRAQLVGSEVEAVEVGQAVLALHLVDAEFDLAEGVVFVFLQVGERDFEDAAFEGVVGVLQTCCAVHEGLADTVISSVLHAIKSTCLCRSIVLSNGEGGWRFDVKPVLPRKRICLLLQAFLALGQSLVLSYGHDGSCGRKGERLRSLLSALRSCVQSSNCYAGPQFRACQEKFLA